MTQQFRPKELKICTLTSTRIHVPSSTAHNREKEETQISINKGTDEQNYGISI